MFLTRTSDTDLPVRHSCMSLVTQTVQLIIVTMNFCAVNKYNNYVIQIRYSTWCNLLYSKFNLNILMELNGLHDKSKNAEREKVHKLTGNVLKSFDVFLLCFVLSCFVLFTCLQAKPTFLLLGNVNQFVGVKT